MQLLTLLLHIAVSLRKRVGAGFCSAATLAVLCVAPALGLAEAAEKESLEKAVKAAYLSKFGLYVEWPDRAFSAPRSPLTICVAGEDPLGSALDKAAADQSTSGARPVAVRRLRTVGQDSGCHILYVGSADALNTRQAIETVRGSNVLTVSDAGPAVGVIIQFVIKDNRVRFEIDDEAAAQNGLVISSKLLSLALNVKRRPSGEIR